MPTRKKWAFLPLAAALLQQRGRYGMLDEALQLDADQIAEALQHGGEASVTLTIPEGWRMEQTAWLR